MLTSLLVCAAVYAALGLGIATHRLAVARRSGRGSSGLAYAARTSRW